MVIPTGAKLMLTPRRMSACATATPRISNTATSRGSLVSGFPSFINQLPFVVLAFCDFSLLRTHFWPVTPFLRKFLSDVAKNFGDFGDNRRSDARLMMGG